MLCYVEAVVAGKNDDRVVCVGTCLERIEYCADLIVDTRNALADRLAGSPNYVKA